MVYVIQALMPRKSNQRFRLKIGRSKNISSRLKGMRCDSPVPLKLLGFYDDGQRTDKEMEKFLHEVFDEYRLHGEWFEMPLAAKKKLLRWFIEC